MINSKVDQAYLDALIQAEFPDPTPQDDAVLLAQNKNMSYPNEIASDTAGGAYVGYRLNKPKNMPTMADRERIAKELPMAVGATAKGMAQGFVGLPGDVVDLGLTVANYLGAKLPEKSGMWTTEDVKGFLDQYIPMGEQNQPYETVGEFLSPGGQVKAAKYGAKGVRKLADMNLPAGLSIKSVGEGVDNLGFYSATSKAVDNIAQEKGTGAQFLAQIQKTPGVKAEELKWTGLDDFLKSKKSVTKTEVQDYLNANRVEVQEINLSNKTASHSGELPKFSKYTLPGGENYREVLLTLPAKDNVTREASQAPSGWGNTDDGTGGFVERGNTRSDYRSSHFDQPNVLAHLRVNDRVDVDGKKVLFVEEIQSDWHQAGRKKGYTSDVNPAVQEYNSILREIGDTPWLDVPQNIKTRLDELRPIVSKSSNSVPDAPFKTNWQELAMKRAIQMAAEGGYDRIAFTTGAQQAARYDLSKQVKMISAMPDKNGKYNIYIEGVDGEPAFRNRNGFSEYGQKTVTPEEFEDLVGKDAAKTIMQKADELNRGKVNKDDFKFYDSRPSDLTVGGEGMKGFYDNILPKFLDKYGKKWDAKTGMTEIRVATDKQAKEDAQLLNDLGVSKSGPNAMAKVHYIDITPKMKESVLTEGQPLFQVAPPVAAGVATSQQEQKEKRIKYDANGRRIQ